ncbi:MAG: hypothetical protein CVT99_10965 [Bacteroidetes bacterium HGW-Bacteroidetes-16]|nr:MAG: hypothetical protein CVT99_10965 [Bacteroidetes bacterium HGW-Bacteroidetes-16]
MANLAKITGWQIVALIYAFSRKTCIIFIAALAWSYFINRINDFSKQKTGHRTSPFCAIYAKVCKPFANFAKQILCKYQILKKIQNVCKVCKVCSLSYFYLHFLV